MLDRNQIRDIASTFLRGLKDAEVTDTDSLIRKTSVEESSTFLISAGDSYCDLIDFTKLSHGFAGAAYKKAMNNGFTDRPINLRLDYNLGEGSVIVLSGVQPIEGYDNRARGVMQFKSINSRKFEDLLSELEKLAKSE